MENCHPQECGARAPNGPSFHRSKVSKRSHHEVLNYHSGLLPRARGAPVGPAGQQAHSDQLGKVILTNSIEI